MKHPIYDFEVEGIAGDHIKLDRYRGKTLLIVNTASKCGFTPQYKGLEQLYLTYKDAGLEILAFPCNQFGGQEPGSNEEIKEFCELRYRTTFPLFAKLDVNGENAHPLYKFLKKELPGLLGTEDIKWNFTKFLISKDGRPLKRFASAETPNAMAKEIAEALGVATPAKSLLTSILG